ncbi:hypothetical protein SAMN02745781_04039 [Vibrio gazogenes DSM 21264]|uniref:Uncharacterized protein n=1 Tax=Vibrio gazogenes DSM 21264 = NBRC 103151 TaxID=1123492 RepID=A0A1M5HA41_VIBGA|nr:hypothetical protein SAMN02745781_04039 [Vibrio gazogenes DSM 21264] [Vibrio gazogenes DSM 21264 = NBRC 103151]SJN53369.1 hypothetical protein BQ6471_00412 [Vibrio gazogenes]
MIIFDRQPYIKYAYENSLYNLIYQQVHMFFIYFIDVIISLFDSFKNKLNETFYECSDTILLNDTGWFVGSIKGWIDVIADPEWGHAWLFDNTASFQNSGFKIIFLILF